MRDFFRFVCRSALGSALAGATFTLLIFLYFFGPLWGLLYLFHPMALLCFAIPGIIVGFMLWIVSTIVGTRMIAIWRAVIGSLVLPAICFVLALYEMVTQTERIEFIQPSFSTPVVCWLLWMTVVGGVAGLAAPSEKRFEKEAGLTYWERVALYEIAQREASLANKARTLWVVEI
jgi:uncharacterized integral membrane protein